LLLVVAASGIGEWVHRRLEPTNLVMLYLAVVMIAAAFLGRGPAIFASIVSVLAFDVLFVSPRFSLTVHDTQYVITFAGLLIVGLIISELTAKVRKLERLKEKEKLHTALLNSISHDLRTPLVAITGTLSHLANDRALLDHPAYKELIETAHEEATRLNRIVTNWLDMTRVEAGILKASHKCCDVQDVVGVALGHMDDMLANRPVHVRIPDDLPEVKMEFFLLMKVLINLIDNAVKYSAPDTPIDIEARMAGEKLEIRVGDRGMGIPAEDLTKVFDKFYRAPGSAHVSGIGLGLPICKGILEAHRGIIAAERRPGGGTVMCVAVPVSARKARASHGN
jgi:two-component system sensor histidine kinase KdpD